LINESNRTTAQGSDHSPLELGIAFAVFAATFLFRWVTIDFDNDYFMHLAWAAEMVRGYWPVRDFVEPGFPAQTWLAYIGLRVWGHQLVWEAVIACGFIAAGVTLTYLVSRRIGIPRWLSLIAVLLAAGAYPRMYAYPKVFAYPAALYALASYVQRPSRRSLIWVAGATAVAFLLRHDHGVWIAIASVVTLVLCHRNEPKALARTMAVYACVAVLLVAPWLAWVAESGHADQYFAFLLGQFNSVGTGERIPDRGFTLDRSKPLVTLAPVQRPIVGIRWAPGASESARRQAETNFGLQSVPGKEDEYRLVNVSRKNVGALISDPAVEDTRGIDRRSLRAPTGWFRWMYCQVQQYVPPVRIRLFSGIIKAGNAEAWLAWIIFLAPWVVIVAVLTRAFVKRTTASIDQISICLVIPAALLSMVTYQTLVRGSTDSRLGDVTSITAVLVAWTVLQAWRLTGWPGQLAKAAAVVFLSLTVASAAAYGQVMKRLDGAGVDGPTNMVRRVRAQAALYAKRPLDVFAPPGSHGLRGLSRWLNACTIETDRVSVIGFEPEVFFVSERGFAGGLAFYDPGWSTSARDQMIALDRWSRQRVPIVLIMKSAWKSFSHNHPTLRQWLDERYTPVDVSNFGGNKTLVILADKSYVPVRTDAATGLPCYR
jgi:hypothetical protein